jgi:hypothetical protein
MTADHPLLEADDEAMIRRLAEMDMAAAEKAHAVLMAAQDAAEIATALLAYQRAARSARQTLMLKGRLKRLAADVTPLRTRVATLVDRARDVAREAAFCERVAALQDAVGRVAAAAHPDDADRQRAIELAQDALIDRECERPDFLHHPLDAHVARHCEQLGLPGELAARWRELPRPPPRPLDDEIALHTAGFGGPADRRESG